MTKSPGEATFSFLTNNETTRTELQPILRRSSKGIVFSSQANVPLACQAGSLRDVGPAADSPLLSCFPHLCAVTGALTQTGNTLVPNYFFVCWWCWVLSSKAVIPGSEESEGFRGNTGAQVSDARPAVET